MLDGLRQDLRHALRTWRRRPAFAAVAVLTLALGVGANTAMFSIVNAVLLRPLPFPYADRIVAWWGRSPGAPQTLVSYPELVELRERSRSFDALGLWLTQSVNLTGTGEPQRITGNFVSGSFFDAVGGRAARGRLFAQDESEPGAAKPVVVISHQFWLQRFQGADSALGTTVTLNGLPLTIVGVLAPPFDAAETPGGGWYFDTDVFIPAGHLPVPGGVRQAGPSFLGVGRMKPAVTITQAAAELDVLAAALEKTYPETQKGRRAALVSLQDTLVGTSRTPLYLLLACVGLVLLIACVNVSNLLLARAIDRQREIALRAALGASRAAVLRQLAVEAALLSTVAATLGLLVGRWSLQTLTWLRPPTVPIPDRIALDLSVLSFTAGIAVLVAVLCALAPAARVSRADLNQALQAGGRRATGGTRRTRDALVVVEVALSVALLAVSGLLIQSMLSLQRVNVGFDPSSVFTLQFRLPAGTYQTPDSIARFFKDAIERVRAVPGVQAAALVRRVPFSGNWGEVSYTAEGRPAASGSDVQPRAGENMITPDYFKTMRIPLLRGRDFTDRDDLAAPPVVIVNETMARTVWPAEDAVGKRVKVPQAKDWATVVGVVGDTKSRTATEPARPQIYIPHYQAPLIFSSLVARTAVPPLGVAADVRKAIWAVDKDQPMWAVAPLDAIVSRTFGSTRFLASLLGVFAGVALLLAAVGIYGVMSYAVTERTHEIGIRMALGASADRVLREIVGRGLALTAVALVIGVAGGAALGRLARGVLFGVGPNDPATFAIAAGLLTLVSLAACFLPARRASRVDPVVALAEE